MEKIDFKKDLYYFDKFEKEKICNLLECSESEIDYLVDESIKIFKNSDSVYDSMMKILQQGYNVREATIIGILCGQGIGFNKAEKQIEADIKQKLFDAFNSRRG